MKATPGRMTRVLESIASGRLSDIGAATLADAFPRCIQLAREGLALCRHCRTPLLSRCDSCDNLHPKACCWCGDCGCPCCAEVSG